MCRASINNFCALLGVPDAGRIVSKPGGEETLIQKVDTFLSKPGVVGHFERNGYDIAANMYSYANDPRFNREIAQRLITMVEKIHPATAKSMKRQLPKKEDTKAKKTEKKSR